MLLCRQNASHKRYNWRPQQVYLFTRPRRFGKTLTMDMIRTYFEKTSTDTSIYFSDKKIWNCGDAYKQLQGTYPVIFLSFKDAHQTNWTDMYRSLCFTLKEEFLRHIELLSSKAIKEYDKNTFTISKWCRWFYRLSVCSWQAFFFTCHTL